MYGETGTVPWLTGMTLGLSPHVRGNREPGPLAAAGAGSIPACTGKPSIRPRARALSRVYPRMYGETLAVLRSTTRT